MQKLHYSLLLTLPLMACAVQTVPAQPAPQLTRVQYRAEHPAYLHALSDLRAARWLLSHRPGDLRVTVDEEARLTASTKASTRSSVPPSMTARTWTTIPPWTNAWTAVDD